MVDFNIDAEKYTYTTKNLFDNLLPQEMIVATKNSNLKFDFNRGEPYLLVDEKEYQFESMGSFIFFLQKLSLNSTLISALSPETLKIIVNEMLQQLSTFNLVVDKNMDTILTVTSMSANLISWEKILQMIYKVFVPLEEKVLYLTTHTGLGISIVMNDADSNSGLDVIRIEPQTTSSISIYRGTVMENISLKGYDEDEILENLGEKLQSMLGVIPLMSH